MTTPIQPEISAPPVPQALESEATYIAAMLAGKLDDAALFLEAAEFHGRNHAVIYAAAAQRLMTKGPIDIALLTQSLASTNHLEIAGGTAALRQFAQMGSGITAPVADENARIIREKAVARSIQAAALSALADAPLDIDAAIKSLLDAADVARSRLSLRTHVELTDATTLRKHFGAQKWLWHNYIPIGHVTCLIAQQGQGKSNVALDICHRVINGFDMPDGTKCGIDFGRDDRILYLDSEGFLQGILSRLQEWGTDDEPFIWPSGCENKTWVLNTPHGWAEFESIVAQYRPRLVIVDSLSGANNLKEADNDEMKTLMQRFVALASRFAIPVLLIHHLRKAGTGEPSFPVNLDRARGASTITQLTRVVLAVGTPSMIDEGNRRLDMIKNNLAPQQPPIGFIFTATGLAWGDAPQPPVKPHSVKPRQQAADWLYSYLYDVEKRLSTDIIEQAQLEGFSSRTVYRAKEEIGVILSREGGQNGRTFWALTDTDRASIA